MTFTQLILLGIFAEVPALALIAHLFRAWDRNAIRQLKKENAALRAERHRMLTSVDRE